MTRGLAARKPGWNAGLASTRPVAIRIKEKTDRSAGSEGCWLWRGAVDQGGRAQIWWNGRVHPVSRVVIALETGTAPPADLYVCHTCDNPLCVNPRHLFLGTPSVNQRDAVSKGRAKQGARKPPLTREQESEALALYASGVSTYEIGRRFGVNRGRVRRLLHRVGVPVRKTS